MSLWALCYCLCQNTDFLVLKQFKPCRVNYPIEFVLLKVEHTCRLVSGLYFARDQCEIVTFTPDRKDAVDCQCPPRGGGLLPHPS